MLGQMSAAVRPNTKTKWQGMQRLKRVFLPGVCLALFPNCIYSRSSLLCPRLKPWQSGLFLWLACPLYWGRGPPLTSAGPLHQVLKYVLNL